MKIPQNAKIVQIDITNACMHQCSNCTRFCGHHQKPFFMDFDTFKRAVDSLDEFQGTIGMIGGEPTLHPEFEKFVKYMYSKTDDKCKNKLGHLKNPQKNFIQAVREHERRQHSICKKGNKLAIINKGMGLWSAMPQNYMRYYELIQDMFNRQLLNDHGNAMYHQPILITRKELAIPDDEWKKLRDQCWINREWSPTITPKGAFFCEVAAAMDMLFKGPGGWPIEPGWWKRKEKDFGEQLSWCEMCGIPLQTFSRDAREEVDDVSPVMYKKLLEIESAKVLNGHVNVLEIENNSISEKSKKTIHEYCANIYTDDDEMRISRDTVLYPDNLDGLIIVSEEMDINALAIMLENNSGQLDHINVYAPENLLKEIHISNITKWNTTEKIGKVVSDIFKGQKNKDYLLILTGNVLLTDNFKERIKNLVINPGILHYKELKCQTKKVSCYVKNVQKIRNGSIILLNKHAQSIKKIGEKTFCNYTEFDELIKGWDKNKVVQFDEDMEYSPNKISIYERIAYLIKNTISM